MPLYSYRAVSAAGDVATGEIEAANESEIVDRLRDQGLLPMQIAQSLGVASGGDVARAPRQSLFAPRRVTRRGAKMLCRGARATAAPLATPADCAICIGSRPWSRRRSTISDSFAASISPVATSPAALTAR